jgi:predicted permease
MPRSSGLKRRLAGLVATVILLPTAYFSYVVGRGMYYDYILFPKLKAEDHYIAPTRWQDFTFLAVFWMFILAVAFLSFRMVRFALKRDVQASPH